MRGKRVGLSVRMEMEAATGDRGMIPDLKARRGGKARLRRAERIVAVGPVRRSASSLIEGDGLRLDYFTEVEGALSVLRRKAPRGALVAVPGGGFDGFGCLDRIRAVLPRLRVVMFSEKPDATTLMRLMLAGANGYLTSPMKVSEVIGALESASSGLFVLGERARTELARLLRPARGRAGAPALTEKEEEVLWWLATGLGNKDISERLGVEPGTVHTHLVRLYRKLQVHGRTEAIRRYFGAGDTVGVS